MKRFGYSMPRDAESSDDSDGSDSDDSGQYTHQGSGHTYLTGASLERAKSKNKRAKQGLSTQDKDDFEIILRKLSVSRWARAGAMGFAFDHVEAGSDIVSTIKASFDTSKKGFVAIPNKVAKLYLLSDMLHNSGVCIGMNGASRYRVLISNVLPDIFANFGQELKLATGRMTSKQIEERVLSVLKVWGEWSIFTAQFLAGLEMEFYDKFSDDRISAVNDGGVLLSLDIEALTKKGRLHGITIPDGENAAIIATKILAVEAYIKDKLFYAPNIHVGAAAVAPSKYDRNALDEIDGAPIDDIDGAPIDDIDGAPIDDADGEPL